VPVLTAVTTDLFELLRCSACGGTLERPRGRECAAGPLTCTRCARDVPVVDGVARFVEAPADETARRTQESFGYEWTHFTDWQPSGLRNFSDYFAGVDLASLRDAIVLDAGCGMGRHARQMAGHAAGVVALDFSQAIDQARRNVDGLDNVICVQGDLFALPLAEESFDYVYSLGVLHHTGDMWRELDLITLPARDKLMVSIYNDQGFLSSIWRNLKSAYVRHPVTRPAVVLAALVYMWGPKLLLQPQRVVRDWRGYYRKRGMSAWHDVIDWAGGYPYEFATPEAVFSFFYERGFHLARLKTCRGRLCCNEFVFTRNSLPAVVLGEVQSPATAATEV